MSADSIAIYVHWPWCASICPYCDFDKQASDFKLADAYIDAMLCHAVVEPSRPVHSVYFGGGTPSLLRPDRLQRILDALGTHFAFAPNPEITLEANPSDIVAHKVEAYLRAGVNRISLGVQSLIDSELAFLGRRHNAAGAIRAIGALKDAGCTNFGLDLMYGLPDQSQDAVAQSLRGLLALEPTHISCYALTLEEETPMGADAAAGRISLPDDDALADRYAMIQAEIARAGLAQYELSNWAKPSFESTHNLTYWRNGEWLGLGSGAAGSIAGRRYKRNPNIPAFIHAATQGDPAMIDEEPWADRQQMRDTLMLGLRLAEGVSNAQFRSRFGVDLVQYLEPAHMGLVDAGVLRWSDDHLALDADHYFVANAVLAEILPEA